MAFVEIDEFDVQIGDHLLMFETGPWGVARVTDFPRIKEDLMEKDGYKNCNLSRPFLYAMGDIMEHGVEHYGIWLKKGRKVLKFVPSDRESRGV